MTKQYHFYLNEETPDESKLIGELDIMLQHKISISALVKDLLKAHFAQVDQLRLKQAQMDYIRHMR